MNFPRFELPDDEEIDKIAASLNSDMGGLSDLEFMLLTEGEALSEEDTALVVSLMGNPEELRRLAPEKLDKIAAVAPGLAAYLRNMRQVLQSGEGIDSTADVAAATDTDLGGLAGNNSPFANLDLGLDDETEG